MRSSIRDSPAVAHLPRALAEAAHPRSPASALDPESLLEELTRGGRRLRALPLARRLEAWRTAVARLLDEASPARRELEAPLAEAVRLSPQGLSAGLRAVASGMLDASADVLFLSAARRRGAARERGAPERGSKPRREPALVVLASNLPGLALQTVLPALACGRPLIVRSSEREPWFAPALMRELTVAEPELGEAFAALTWEHGGALEDALLARCDPVLAYGGGAALAAMRARVRGRFVEYGPKLSLGIVGDAVTDEEIERLARDVALFDQRGCLSVQVVFSRAPLERVAAGLARGLDRQADLLPPGPATFEEHAALRRELDLAREPILCSATTADGLDQLWRFMLERVGRPGEAAADKDS